MAKFDAVDRLMKLAEEKTGPSSRPGAVRAPEAPLQEQVQAVTPGTSVTGLPPQKPSSIPRSPGERGRQMLGALRPFLPAVGGVLRRVEHPAVQAVAHLMPLIGSLRAGSAPDASSQAVGAPGSSQASLDRERSALEIDCKALRARADTKEEQLRNARVLIERTAAEQGSLEHRARGLAGRVHLLTAGLIVLLLLVIAETVLLAISLRR